MLILLVLGIVGLIGYMITLHFNLYIDPSLHIKKMVFSDYYQGNHFILGSSAKLYEISITEYQTKDDRSRSSRYGFTSIIEGMSIEAYIDYPGTPQRQYYGFPRLSSGEKYILITSQELSSKKTISLVSGYYLFLIQNIDGVEYAYPCVYDTSMIPLSIISDSENFKYVSESQIYDSWYDADVCDYLKKYSHSNPEFSYKLLADDLRQKYHLLLRR